MGQACAPAANAACSPTPPLPSFLVACLTLGPPCVRLNVQIAAEMPVTAGASDARTMAAAAAAAAVVREAAAAVVAEHLEGQSGAHKQHVNAMP